tara:strand:+ start:38 stop:370 length:333 start_codon:yes stop_codon:yes gene_type:complete
MWPGNAAQAADWPRLAEAWSSLRHCLLLKEASEAQAGRYQPACFRHTGATAALGFCAGRACRAAGDTAAVGIGGAVVLLGGLAKAGYIVVDIPKIEKQVPTTSLPAHACY